MGSKSDTPIFIWHGQMSQNQEQIRNLMQYLLSAIQNTSISTLIQFFKSNQI